ncbi:hypothetical protein KUTeg_008268 [Tegillarca granosa]|uniref:Chitin-binding type-2 domain-containing protein n=1 Tax=Tegillarca granosa TaxID=220873 RepID=A0ABQ9FCY6_TEGGR|nr:hypothetical protein KUTeg_008268 [Tegillarca granosa]
MKDDFGIFLGFVVGVVHSYTRNLSNTRFGDLFKDTSGQGTGTGGSIPIGGGNDNNPLANIDELVGRDLNPQTGGSSTVDPGGQNNTGSKRTSVFGDVFTNTGGGGGGTGDNVNLGGNVGDGGNVGVGGGNVEDGGNVGVGGGNIGEGGNVGVGGGNVGNESNVGVGGGNVGEGGNVGVGGGNVGEGGNVGVGGGNVGNESNVGVGGGNVGDGGSVGVGGGRNVGDGGSVGGGSNVGDGGSADSGSNTRTGAFNNNSGAGSTVDVNTVIDNSAAGSNLGNRLPSNINNPNIGTGTGTGNRNNRPVVEFGGALPGKTDPVDAVKTAHTWRHDQTHSRKKELWTPEAKAFCAENCVNVDQNHCNFGHENNCYYFYHCYNGPSWGLVHEICAFGSYYNNTAKQCDHVRNVNCQFECPFKQVNTGKPEDIYFYMNGGIKQLCAYGTVFKQQQDGTGCYRCLKDENGKLMPDCMNKVNITFTTSEWNLNTQFSNHAAGTHEFKMVRRDGGYGKFNTKALVKIENYHATGNAFKKGFYTNITFKHDPKGDPEVLMSSCTPVMDSTPSLHIVLSNQNVVATIITDTKLTTLTVPYEPNQINNLLFDVQSFLGSIHTVTLTVTPENPVAGKTYTKTETGEFGTAIKENGPGESPLTIGGCERNGNVVEGQDI